MRTRNLLVIGSVVAAMFAAEPSVVNARPVDVDRTVSSLSAPAGGTVGVGGTGFRRVRDVVRQAASARGPVASSLDPELAALADDSSAFIDSTGRLLYIEQFDVAQAGPAAPPAPEIAASSDPEIAQGVYLPPANPFSLNSRPGSAKTIFLDFDGYTVTGTKWNDQTGIVSRTVAPYATDELIIRAIWQAVAEDYAAFDVNVTTQQPSDAALHRSSLADNAYGATAVITPDKWLAPSSICGDGCGGIAYVDIFGEYRNAFNTTTPADRYYGPAWVFAAIGSNWTSVADTISHEVGHNLGLNHDGLRSVTNGDGCPTSDYFSGNGSGTGSWGPIMGAPFGRQYTQWSKGEYACANNQLQDDVAIIGAKMAIIGATTGFVPDESSSLGNAVPIPTTELPTTDQMIGSAGDLDYFSITVTSGYLKVTLTRSTNGTSLYPRYAVLNSSGTELAFANLSDTNSGSIVLPGLSPGVYYVSVTGSGLRTPQTGFSSYGSLGYYNVAAQTSATPSTPGSPLLAATRSQELRASWSASTSLSPLPPITYAVSLCDAVSAVCGTPIDTTATALVLTPPSPTGSYVARVNARHVVARVSASASSAAETVLTAPIAPTPFSLSFNEIADTVTITWAGEQEFSPVLVTGRRLTVVIRGSTGLPVLQQAITPASGSLTFSTALANVWLDAWIVLQTGYDPPWSSSAPSPTGSVFLGRNPAPQATGSTAGGSRQVAPQSPGTAAGSRPPAPQA